MKRTKLSQELSWRGFVNQTTFQDITELDKQARTLYFGVDPSADSMTVGNLAAAMMVRHFIDHGYKAVLLVGGATGMIGDPDGKAEERALKTPDEIARNKKGIAAEYKQVFAGQDFKLVDNYDWFKDLGYLDFLRDVGKHVPMSQMLGREFVQSRLGEGGAGISYAEFSYSLIQGYDFLHLYREKGVTLQVCGADQWGNSIAGVELIRRITGKEAHVWSVPLVVNKVTGKKFGKSEEGAVWLSPKKTSPYQFYQFWLSADDEGAEDYLKIYTLLSQEEITELITEFNQNKAGRAAQKRLAYEVTKLIHGKEQADTQTRIAEAVTAQKADNLSQSDLHTLLKELQTVDAVEGTPIVDLLVDGGLAQSKSEARQFLSGGAVYINGVPINVEIIASGHWVKGIAFLRRGKVLKNTILLKRK